METVTHSEIEEIRKDEAGDPEELKEFRRYTRGEQNRTLSLEQRRFLGGKAKHSTADNVLRLILTTYAARLELTEISCAEQKVNDFLKGLALRNSLGKLQFDTHFAMARDGNTGVSLRWKRDERRGGRVTLHRERWWDGEAGIFAAYGDDDLPAWAVKEWTERVPGGNGTTRTRSVVYYEDRIERFVKEGRGWMPFNLPGEETVEERTGRAGVVPWVKRDGTPLGIPVVHFPNGSDDDSLYGQSELVGLLGLQDDLNGIQADISAAATFAGFQMYWFTGVDASEKLIVGPGRAIKLQNPNAKAGVFPPGSMDALTESHAYKRQTMAVDTATPLHLISGKDWPSGEALMRAEMPLVDKVRRAGRVAGPAWTTVGHRATEIANTFGEGGLNEDAPIVATFAAPERLDEMTQIQVQRARVELYAAVSRISDPLLLEKLGLFTDEEIAKILQEREQMAAVAVEAEF